MTDGSYEFAFDVVLACMAEAVLLHGDDGAVLYANEAARALFGAEPVGMRPDRLIRHLGLTGADGTPLTPDGLASARARAAGTVQRDVYVLTTRTPRVVVASVVAPVRRDGIEATVAVWHDVTERYDAEGEREELLFRLEAAVRAQQRERDVLDALMENTPAHLAYLDRDMRFVAVNATYAAGSGHSAEEIIGRDHFELFPNAENEAVFKRARDLGETVEYRAKPFEFADQPWRGVTYWDWRLTPVKDRDGEVQGLVLSLVDVTATVRAKRFSDAVNHLNDIIHSTLHIDDILAQVVPQLADAVGCEMVAVGLRGEEADWVLAEAYGVPGELKGASFTDEAVPGFAMALETRAPLIAAASDDPLVSGGLAGRLGVQSMMVVPLALPDHPLGALSFGYVSGPGEFDEAQVDFADKVSVSLSLALNNARTFENEHRVAQVLQESMLALPSALDGVRFAHEYQAASESALVGGDFYDLFDIERDVVGVLIGDVAGKGLDAAVLTSVVKNTVRAHAAERGNTPGRVLELTNDLLFRTTPPEAFATVFFGVLDLRNGHLRYANAGHTAAGVLGRGSVRKLASNSPLLGAFSHTRVAESDALVAEGELLFLYTDGLIESRSERSGEQFGEERLLGFLGDLPRTPESVVRLVTGAVMDFTGGTLRDDMAILAVERLAR